MKAKQIVFQAHKKGPHISNCATSHHIWSKHSVDWHNAYALGPLLGWIDIKNCIQCYNIHDWRNRCSPKPYCCCAEKLMASDIDHQGQKHFKIEISPKMNGHYVNLGGILHLHFALKMDMEYIKSLVPNTIIKHIFAVKCQYIRRFFFYCLFRVRVCVSILFFINVNFQNEFMFA